MHVNNLATCEAVLNIFANFTEIVGLRYCSGFLFAGVLVAFLKKWALCAKYVVIGLVSGIVGLAMPGLINLAVVNIDNNVSILMALTVFCAVIGIVVLTVGVALFFYPTRIARLNGKTELTTINALSAFSIIFAPLWSISLFLAHKPVKAMSAPAAAAGRTEDSAG